MSPRRILGAGVAGGVALFVWGVVSWTVLPFHRSVLRTLPGEDRVVADLRESGTGPGMYRVPGDPADGDRGPRALVLYDPSGTPPNHMFRPMALALVASILAATLSSFVLSEVRTAGYAGRMLLAIGFGVLAWLLGPATEWIWFPYPAGHVLASLLDAVAGWAIVGAVQAGLLKSGSGPA
jgi:hypothetical protein